MLVTAVHITQQTWRCSWYPDPSRDGTENLPAMLHGPRELPCSETPCRGSTGTLVLPGTSRTAAPVPAEAHGELSPSVIPVYINSESLPGSPVPHSSAGAGVWIPAGDGLSFTHGLIPARCRGQRGWRAPRSARLCSASVFKGAELLCRQISLLE